MDVIINPDRWETTHDPATGEATGTVLISGGVTPFPSNEEVAKRIDPETRGERVPKLKAGELDAHQVKLGAASRVKMPNGRIFPAGGELLALALRNGGVQIDDDGNEIETVVVVRRK